MPEIPTEAVRAALAAIERELTSRPFDPFFKGDVALAAAVLEAALPHLQPAHRPLPAQPRPEVHLQGRHFLSLPRRLPMPEPPMIPEEAIQAAAEAERHVHCSHTLGWSCAECRARASVGAAAPILAAHERRKIAEGFRALAAKCRAIPDDGLNLGQIWQRDEQARDYDRIADMIEERADV